MAKTPASRARRSAVVLSSLALLLSGCSLQITSEPDPTIDDGTLLMASDNGNPTFSRNFNPFLPNARTSSDIIYEPLILENPLDGELTPSLAESWEQPDPSIVTMTLREDVTWQDGEPLTVEDVLFTFELLEEHPALDASGAWSRINSVESQGQTIIFNLQGDDVPALSVLGSTLIVPQHIWSEVENPETWRNEEPIGSGPFQLSTFSRLQYSMDRYAGYWQQIDVERLVMPAATEDLDLVATGFDWAFAFLSDVEDTWEAANPRNEHWYPPAGIVGLQPNHELEPFDDVEVRRGLALALDHEAIAESATEGSMDAASQTGLLLPNQQDQLNPEIESQGLIEQDQDAALESFEQAGFEYRDGTLYDSDGEPFTFSITTANGYNDWLRAGQEVRRQLSDIGIDVDVQAPQAAAYEAVLANGDYEVAIASSNNGGNPYSGYNNLLSGDFYAPVGESTQNNRIRYQNPEVDELLQEYRKTVDQARQQEISYRLQEIFVEDTPIISLYYAGLWGLYNDGRFTGWPTEEDPYAPLQAYDSVPLLIFPELAPVEEGENP